MNDQEYKYDVAFSFLAKDEAIAVQLNELVKGRLETFLYSERQREIAGTDGEKTFNEVFFSYARIVVVLYREHWGQTKWTRIEETAIRNRAFEEGYEFVLFIPLDQKPAVPKWLPRTQLWIGLERWGMQGAASVIEARIQQFGGMIKEENAIDKAEQLVKKIDFEKRRREFLKSSEGVQAANKEVVNLYSEVTKISQKMQDFRCSVDIQQFQCKVIIKVIAIYFNWYNPYINTLNESYLEVNMESSLGRYIDIRSKGPRKLDRRKFNFDIDDLGQYGWRESSQKEIFHTTKQLADFCLKKFVEKVGSVLLNDSKR